MARVSATAQLVWAKEVAFVFCTLEGEEQYILLFIDRRRDLDDWPSDTILRMLEESGLWPPSE